MEREEREEVETMEEKNQEERGKGLEKEHVENAINFRAGNILR